MLQMGVSHRNVGLIFTCLAYSIILLVVFHHFDLALQSHNTTVSVLVKLKARVVRLPCACQLQLQQSCPVEHDALREVHSLMLRRETLRYCAKNNHVVTQ